MPNAPAPEGRAPDDAPGRAGDGASAGGGPLTEAPSLEAYTDTERQIFDAALAVFARKGKDGARMQEIADAASINKAMVHYYFRSKDQLYRQVFVYTMQRFMASFGAALQEAATFAEMLRAFINGYVSFVSANGDAMRLMMGENLTGGDLIVEHMRPLKEHPSSPPQVMIRKITEAIEAGEIRAVSPHHALLTIVSGCLFPPMAAPTVRLMHPEAAADWSAFLEARKQHLFDLVYHGLKPDGG
jgi:TetR/AcrR family transcriptional regulator